MVEKGTTCEEIADRTLTVAPDGGNVHRERLVVQSWRGVAPCGED